MKILLVDAHALVRAGLRRILCDGMPEPKIGEASSAPEALTQLRREKWDVAILDLSLGGRGGLDVLKLIHAEYPDCAVLVMSTFPEDLYGVRAFRAGASGYVPKTSEPEEFVQAVRKVATGGKHVPAAIAEQLAASVSRELHGPPHLLLSDRELEVLRHFGTGMTVKQVGTLMHLSDKTVSTYRSRILQKMNLRTTAELIRYALRERLVE